MENQRTLLYLAFFFTLFLLYQAWQKDYGPQPVVSTEVNAEQLPAAADKEMAASSDTDFPAERPAESEEGQSTAAEVTKRESVHVITDVLDLYIDTQGGTIYQLDLLKYQKSAKEIDTPFRLFSTKESKYHIAESGLKSTDFAAPESTDVFKAEKSEYRLEESSDELKVVMVWEKDDISIQKVFTFKRDSYVIDVEHIVNAEKWSGFEYRRLVRSHQERESTMMPTYVGGVVHNEVDRYEKLDFDDIAEQNFETEMKGGWIAMIQHYFLAAWVPDQTKKNRTYTYHPQSNRYILVMNSTLSSASSDAPAAFKSQLVVGPKLHDKLAETAPGLELTVDYGPLTIISDPLFWLLKQFHDLFNNWGWAIIFLTITVKLIFYKLSEVGYRSMARMRKVTPRLQSLKERYGDNRQRMSQEMMKLYKEEKINPLGGCFPILIQIPVFIALYYVLLESVELRNAPFALWIQNLSEQDPYFILPILMGATMYIQQKLNPAPVDPVQQKVFQFMPLVFTVFFLFFPAGLVLYWVVNNTLSIAQQWVITKRIESSDK